MTKVALATATMRLMSPTASLKGFVNIGAFRGDELVGAATVRFVSVLPGFLLMEIVMLRSRYHREGIGAAMLREARALRDRLAAAARKMASGAWASVPRFGGPPPASSYHTSARATPLGTWRT